LAPCLLADDDEYSVIAKSFGFACRLVCVGLEATWLDFPYFEAALELPPAWAGVSSAAETIATVPATVARDLYIPASIRFETTQTNRL
jgi:hypothetical protein